MTSEALQKARDFEARHGPHIPNTERPAFHANPTIGGMNGPNGFSPYKGECRLFCQNHPCSNEWGPIRWERLPEAGGQALIDVEKYDHIFDGKEA